jgi:hypothetical protein
MEIEADQALPKAAIMLRVTDIRKVQQPAPSSNPKHATQYGRKRTPSPSEVVGYSEAPLAEHPPKRFYVLGGFPRLDRCIYCTSRIS